jgi:gamma-glutamyltranspeptidase
VTSNGQSVVACAEKNASAAALEVLKQGGNAFDAAVAVMAVLGLTRPGNCGIGGGGFATLYQGKTKKTYFINGRERAPRSARSNMFLNSNGIQLPFNAAISSAQSIGVPGTIAMMDKITQFGKIRDWKILFNPAIQLSTNGFTVDNEFYDRVLANVWKLKNYNYSKQLFLSGVGGTPLPVGSTFYNPNLADTYKQLASNGPEYFYKGQLGTDFVNAVQNFPSLISTGYSSSNPTAAYSYNNPTPSLASNYTATGTLMTMDDLQAYTADLTYPLYFTYRGYQIFSAPPPSSGGLTIAAMLKTMEPYNVKSLAIPDVWALFLNAQAASWVDRNAYMADAEFVNVPIAGLLNNTYLANRSVLLWSNINNPISNIAPVPVGNPFVYQPASSSGNDIYAESCVYQFNQLQTLDKGTPLNCSCNISDDDSNTKQPGCTTSFTIADSENNVICVTFTIETIFGTGASVPNRGFLMNNELTDFNFGGLSASYTTKSFTGSVTLGSNVISGISSTAGITVGQFIYDNNTVNSSTPNLSFPNGTTVVSVLTNSITVSNNALLTNATGTFIATPTTVAAGSFSPGGANEVAAFKRPRSSMSPTIVLDSNSNPVMSVGSAGGANIIATVAAQILFNIEFGYNAIQAMNNLRLINTNSASSTSLLNGSDTSLNTSIITTLNARVPSYNIVAPANIISPPSTAATITFDSVGNCNSTKTGAAQDYYQMTPAAPGFLLYSGSSLSLP